MSVSTPQQRSHREAPVDQQEALACFKEWLGFLKSHAHLILQLDPGQISLDHQHVLRDAIAHLCPPEKPLRPSTRQTAGRKRGADSFDVKAGPSKGSGAARRRLADGQAKVDIAYQWGRLRQLKTLAIPGFLQRFLREGSQDAFQFIGRDVQIAWQTTQGRAKDIDTSSAYLCACVTIAKDFEDRQDLDAARLIFIQAAIYRMCKVIDPTVDEMQFTGQRLKRSLRDALLAPSDILRRQHPHLTGETALELLHNWIRAGCRIEALRASLSSGALLLLAPFLTRNFLRRKAPLRSDSYNVMVAHLRSLDIATIAQPFDQLAGDVRDLLFKSFHASWEREEAVAGEDSRDGEDRAEAEEEDEEDDVSEEEREK